MKPLLLYKAKLVRSPEGINVNFGVKQPSCESLECCDLMYNVLWIQNVYINVLSECALDTITQVWFGPFKQFFTQECLCPVCFDLVSLKFAMYTYTSFIHKYISLSEERRGETLITMMSWS